MEEAVRREFLKARRRGIGGSDWGAVLNLKPYGCARRLMYEKLGTDPDYPEERSGYLDRGAALEPLVAEETARRFGRTLRRPGALPSGVAPHWWIGNPDRLVVPDGIWEGKTMHPMKFKRVVKEGIPVEHVLQVQHYIRQANRKYGLYTVLEPVSWDFYHQQLNRDDALIKEMERAGQAFWNLRTEQKLPPALDPSDHRCRNCQFRLTCQGEALFEAVPELAPGELPIVENAELDQLLVERDELDDVLKMARDLKDSNSARIRELLEGPQKIRTGAGRNVYWIVYEREQMDTARLKREEPLLAKKYLKSQVVNQLRIY